MAILGKNPKWQIDTNTGSLGSGYKLFTYVTGTTTKKATYTTSAASVEQANPIILNSRGEPSNPIYFSGIYKLVFAPDTDTDPPVNAIWTVDPYNPGEIEGDIYDANGNVLLSFTTVASAVNNFDISNNSTGNPVILSAEGSDTNISVQYKTKGSGTHQWIDGNGNELLTSQAGVTSAVNNLSVKNAATGNNPELRAEGGDANAGVDIVPKGTGVVRITGTADSAAELRLLEDTDNGTNYIGLKAPASVTSNVTFTLPSADGTSSQALTTNGSGALSFATLTSAGSFKSMQVFTANDTWTKPAGVSKVLVFVTGGGGGGGGPTAGNASGGGGAGATAIEYITSPGATETITVGSGGGGGTTGNGGSTGGTSSFGSHNSAAGGVGGASAGSGGTGGTATGGTINIQGGGGGSGNNSDIGSGVGGSSWWGGGGPGVIDTGGTAGTAYGSGGSGGSNGAFGGGAGKAGIIWVLEFE